MITSYKNRAVSYDKPVLVYRNLHKKCYSIKQDGLVIGHCNSIVLKNCEFIINKSGQLRTRKEGTKNVHAFIKGTVHNDVTYVASFNRVSYNPYKNSYFMNYDNPIFSAEFVALISSGAFIN